jgi:hypothetical protein
MNWGDVLLRLLVRRRDRETISGDLLEEYREEILPRKGPFAARAWYFRQVVSFVSPVAWGLAIGLAVGSAQLLDTAIQPLADDSAGSMIGVVSALMFLWIVASAAAGRRSDRFRDTVAAGLLVGLATMAIVQLAALVRVNVFLEQIRFREDWVNLVSRFHASGFQSLRVYANYEYVRQSPILLALGAVAGGFCGVVAGAINGHRTPFARAPR